VRRDQSPRSNWIFAGLPNQRKLRLIWLKSAAELCKFVVRVTCETVLGSTRYYIRTNANCFHHNNHSPSDDILCRQRNIPPKILSLLSQMLLRHCPVSVGKTLLQEITGRDVSVDSIRRLKHQLLSGQFSDDNTTNRQSTGQQLLNLLKSSEALDHIYLCASRDLGSSLVTLRRQNKRQFVYANGTWFVYDACYYPRLFHPPTNEYFRIAPR
jgi:hypothetical protein